MCKLCGRCRCVAALGCMQISNLSERRPGDKIGLRGECSMAYRSSFPVDWPMTTSWQ